MTKKIKNPKPHNMGEPPLDPPEPVDHDAIRRRRDQKQRDDWEINNYGIDPELGGIYGIDFDDEVGFRD